MKCLTEYFTMVLRRVHGSARLETWHIHIWDMEGGDGDGGGGGGRQLRMQSTDAYRGTLVYIGLYRV